MLVLLGMSALTWAQPRHFHTSDIAQSEKVAAFARGSANRLRDVDVHYHRFFWRLNPEQQFVTGEVTTHFTHEQPQQQISFDLQDNLTVSYVLRAGDTLAFSHQNDVLTIFLTETATGLDSVTIAYFGSPHTEGLGTFSVDTSAAGNPVLWTLSQPYGAAGWWPCNNALGDRIDSMDLFINVPDGYTAASLGLLFNRTVTGNTETFHWKHKHSVPAYLVAVAVADYVLIEQQVPLRGDTLLVQHYFYPESVEQYRFEWERMPQMLQLYDSLLGPYPYMDEKYGQAQFTRGGGMEHNTISFMADYFPELVAHELIHHWAGNRITCASWQELWLNEGVTTYLSSFVYENFYDKNYYPDWLREAKERVLERPKGMVFAQDTTDVEALFDPRLRYVKPAYVLHMLRRELGDSAFFKGMQNYLNDSSLINGFAASRDFIAHFEATSDRNLEWFFNQWMHQPGYPILSLSYETRGGLLIVDWEQESLAENQDLFRFKVDVVTSQRGEKRVYTLEIENKSGKTVFHTDTFVDSLWLDPYNHTAVLTGTISRVYRTSQALLFPNPTGETATFNLPNLETLTELYVYTETGALFRVLRGSGGDFLNFDVSSWPQGKYVLTAQSNTGASYSQTLVIQR